VAFDPTRLYTALQNTQLQQKDNALYQVLRQLIGALSTLTTQTSGIISGGGVVNNFITAPIMPAFDGVDGEDGLIIPGVQGIQGIPGLIGPWISEDPNVEDLIPSTYIAPIPISVFTSTLTGTQNDFSFKNANLIRMNNATDVTIDGFLAGFDGQIVTIVSIGVGNVFLAHQNAGSAAANRLINKVTGVNTPLAATLGSATYQYDAITTRWRLIFHDQGSAISYTPVWTGSVSNPAIGNGTLSGTYFIRSTQLLTVISIIMGSTTTFGSGFWQISTIANPSGLSSNGAALAIDVVGGANWPVNATWSGAANTGILGSVDATGANVDATHPFAWANTDQYRVQVEFAIS